MANVEVDVAGRRQQRGSTNSPQTSTLAQSQEWATCSQRLIASARAISASTCGSFASASARMWLLGLGAAVVGPGQRRDLLQRQPGALRDVDDREPVQHVVAVAALAGYALGLGRTPTRS